MSIGNTYKHQIGHNTVFSSFETGTQAQEPKDIIIITLVTTKFHSAFNINSFMKPYFSESDAFL